MTQALLRACSWKSDVKSGLTTVFKRSADVDGRCTPTTRRFNASSSSLSRREALRGAASAKASSLEAAIMEVERMSKCEA